MKSRIDTSARGAYLIGPGFAVAALATPTLIALVSFAHLRHVIEEVWVGQANLTSGALFAIQHALLTVGLTVGVTSVALVMYRWPLTRRMLHLILFCIPVELFYRLVYGGAVSSGVVLSMAETNLREAGELLAGHAVVTACLVAVEVLALYALVVSWSADIRFPLKRCIQLGAFSALMILASVAMITQRLGGGWRLQQTVMTEAKDTFPFDVAKSLVAVATGVIDTHRQAARRAGFIFSNARMENAASRGTASEIYVVVVGEASRRGDWSLFGYSRPTTPRLDAIRSDLVVFKRMTSNATITVLSVPLALTRAAPATWDIARSEKSIVSLLKQAGFETFWISNQEHFGANANAVSAIALEAGNTSFPDDVHQGIDTSGFDSNLLIRLDDVLASSGKTRKIVVFLHMLGSHFDYKDRYPATFDRFRDGRETPRILSNWQMRLVNEYDNTVYFTDYIVREVIDKLALCGCKAALIYFSDHGERLFDNGLTDNDFGHGFPTVSRQEIEIPFFLWLSSAYQIANASRVARLKGNAQSVAQLHNLFETIVDLTGVDYDNRATSLSLFSETFHSPSKLDVLDTKEEAISLPVEKGPNEH